MIGRTKTEMVLAILVLLFICDCVNPQEVASENGKIFARFLIDHFLIWFDLITQMPYFSLN